MTLRFREMQQRNQEAVANNAERLLSDTRFSRLRTRRARIALVVSMATAIVLILPAWTLGGSFVGLVSVVVAAVGWWLLKLSVRDVADLPDQFLDERQLAVRNQVYVEAYRWFAAVMVVLASAGLLAFITLGEDPDTWSVDLTWEWCSALFWIVIACALAFPSMALAVRDRDDVPVDDC